MRTRVILATAVILAWLTPVDALGKEEIRVAPMGTGRVRIEAGTSGGERQPKPPAQRRRGTAGPLHRYRTLEFRDGEYCTVTRFTRDRVRATVLEMSALDTNNVLVTYPLCPRTQNGATEVARAFWDERELPSPTLRAAPGWAVAGKPVYLEIVGDRERTFEVDNPIGPDVVIHATSEYVVDWGDRHNPATNVTRTRSPGGPWPSGDVTHVYTHVEEVTITVTQRWRATWTAGEDEGTLDTLRTEGRLPNFRIAQLQAVRTR